MTTQRITQQACAIVVMAKAPVPGYAKTRLIPALGAQRAAELAQWLLNRTMTAALAARLGQVELCTAPDTSHPAFTAWADKPGVLLAAQSEGDLGVRMTHAFERSLRSASAVLLMGTDAPQLDVKVLLAAADALKTVHAVFVPAFDGGYALVGLRQAAPQLFADMPWSTSEVMQITRERLQACGLRYFELQALHDIDEPADLTHLEGLGWL